MPSGVVADWGGTNAVGLGLVGPKGCLGLLPYFGLKVTLQSAVAVTECTTVEIDDFALRDICQRHPQMQSELQALFHQQIAHAMSLAGCNARHLVDQRLARWLLTAADHLDDDRLRFTHNQIAALIGVRRVTITLALQKLEGERAIRSNRGVVVIRDRSRLEACSCACYSQRMFQAEAVGRQGDRPTLRSQLWSAIIGAGYLLLDPVAQALVLL